jgi:hypothetical protein
MSFSKLPEDIINIIILHLNRQGDYNSNIKNVNKYFQQCYENYENKYTTWNL